jgi:hypothetical protein
MLQEDAVLEYPQAGERIRGRSSAQIRRTEQPRSGRVTERGAGFGRYGRHMKSKHASRRAALMLESEGTGHDRALQ